MKVLQSQAAWFLKSHDGMVREKSHQILALADKKSYLWQDTQSPNFMGSVD